MLGRRLEYESQKAVLLYMDANVRFRISAHMPSIRSVEKVVPLKINRLLIKNCAADVNDTSYELGVIQHYPDGNTPEPTEKLNNMGGLRVDYDEFGFADISGHDLMLPGDISFGDSAEERLDTEEMERYYRDELRVYRKALEILTGLEAQGLTVADYVNSLEPIPDDEVLDENKRVTDALKYCADTLPYFVELRESELLPFHCRRHNLKPPFTCYIQLTIKRGRSKQIHRFEYTKKLYEAEKYLNEVLFGSRPISVVVRILDFPSETYRICRLPVGLRLQVHKVRNAHYKLDHFLSLIENSGSLDTVEMHCRYHPAHFRPQITLNAKKLIIADVPQDDLQLLAENIEHLPNLEISILPREPFHLPELYSQLIQAWLSAVRPVGASCWISMRNEETANWVLQLVRARFEWSEQTERCVTILLNDFTKVEVYYDRIVGDRLVLKVRIVEV